MAVNNDDVEWAYQLLLGRAPEAEAVRFWMSNAADLRHLLDSLSHSQESLRSIRPSSGHLNDKHVASQQRLLSILRRLAPHTALDSQKVRLGRDHDGGYVMIDDFENVSVAYSLGINDDASWDLDLANRGIEIFQYDHSIDQPPVKHPLLKWSKLGVKGREVSDSQYDTLPNILQKNGHCSQSDMILKCDIEGDEWEVFGALTTKVLEKFRQIIVELHFAEQFADYCSLEVMRKSVAVLTANHRTVHVHANNFAPYLIVAGVPLPAVLEVTLLRRDCRILERGNEIFPSELDMPNAPDRDDYALGTFQF